MPAPRPARSLPGNQRGVTYLMVMMVVVLMGISLTVIGQLWSVVMARDREAELLFRGTRLKQAIEAYAADYEVRKGTRSNQYPSRLDQLTAGPKRYVPTIYPDPLTGQEFETVLVNGEIRGVKSRSTDVPFDKVRFKDASSYRDIAFLAIPPSAVGQSCAPQPNSTNPPLPLGPGECQPPAQTELPEQ